MKIKHNLKAKVYIKQIMNSSARNCMNLQTLFYLVDCTDNKVIGTLGDTICVSPKSSCSMFNTTKTLVNLTITHFPLKYFDPDEKEYTTVVIPGDKFNTDFKGWVVDYNESRIEQTLKIGKQNFTCHDIGLYRIIFHYKKDGDGICEFDIESSGMHLLYHIDILVTVKKKYMQTCDKPIS